MTAPASTHHLQILRLIRQSGRITRRKLAEQLGTSFSLISRVAGELLDLGLVQEAGRSESVGGRPADLLMLAPDAAYVVGIDAGGDVQRAVLLDCAGSIVAQAVIDEPLASDPELIVESLGYLFQQVRATAGVSEQAVLGLGAGLSALVDPIAGRVYGGPRTNVWADPWTGYPLLAALTARFPGLRISVDDVVRTAGLAEARYGRGAGHEDFIYILADTGLGMALMIDGQAYLGSSRVTGEIGHLIIGGAPIPCYCGNTGCVEQLASTGAILREVRRGLSELPTLSMLARPGAELDIDAVITAAEQGDKLAYRSVLEAGEFLGAALAVVFNLLGPRLIVVGGAMASSEVYLDAARRVMRLRAISLARGVLLARGELGDLAGARGAATFVLDRLFDPGDTNILALR
jgi:predicted NBD/HSP70 family sugar kinase